MRENHWQDNWFDNTAVIPLIPNRVIDALERRVDALIAPFKPGMLDFWQWMNASAFAAHEKQILSSIVPFIQSCQTSAHAPDILELSRKILHEDMALVLLVSSAYFFLEYHVNKLEGAFYAMPFNFTLTLLSAGLLLVTSPYNVQFFLHKMALQQKLPEAFELMGLESGRQQISNAVCKDCNVLRHNKGLFRDLVTYIAQQAFLFAIRAIPYLVSPAGSRAVSYLSLIAHPFEWLFTGQLLIGYPLFAAKLCQREVLTNLQEHPEFCLALGLTYHVSFALITQAIALLLKAIAVTPLFLYSVTYLLQALVFVPYLLSAKISALSTAFLVDTIKSTELFPAFFYEAASLTGQAVGAINGAIGFSYAFIESLLYYVMRFLLEPWGQLPTSTYENFLAAFLTIAFIGLAHHVPFPAIVQKSTRFRPDFLTCVFSDLFTDASIYLAKERILKKAGERKEQLLSFQKMTHDFYLKLSENKNEQSTLMVYVHRLLFRLADLKLTVWKKALPALLQNKEAIYQDKIIELVLPKILIEAHNLFAALIEFRKRAKNILSWIKKIDSFFSNRRVKILSWCMGLKGVTDLLTLDFIIHQGPSYLDELQNILAGLKDYWIINDAVFTAIDAEVAAFKKNLVFVQKIIGGLPESFVDELVSFIRNEQSEFYLRQGMAFVFDMLKKADPKLKEMGDELFDQFVYLTDKKEDCDFLETAMELESTDFHRHFRAGSTISFSRGAGPVISYVEEEGYAVVTQSCDLPSSMLFQQSGERPVLVTAPSSDGFDSEEIPSDQEAFAQAYSDAAFKEKKPTTAESRHRFLATMRENSKEKLARVVEECSFGRSLRK